MHAIFKRLRVDERLRCREVCRAWRDALDDRALWRTLDFIFTCPFLDPAPPAPAPAFAAAVANRAWPAQLSAGWQRLLAALAAGGAFTQHDALLLAAAARADGELDTVSMPNKVTWAALLAVVTVNPALTNVYVQFPPVLSVAQCAELLRLAPQAHLRRMSVRCGEVHLGSLPPAPGASDAVLADARRVLRREPPFDRLHVRTLLVHLPPHAPPPTEDALLAFAADVAAYPEEELSTLNLWSVKLGDNLRALDALVDAALARKVERLTLMGAGLTRTSLPALARLLGSTTLCNFRIWNFDVDLLDNETDVLMGAPITAQLLCNALRANSTLQWFELTSCGLVRAPTAFELVLDALRGHRSISRLVLSQNTPHPLMPHWRIGHALAALVAANAPALEYLDLHYCALGEAVFLPIAAAIAHNTHLQHLDALANLLAMPFLLAHVSPVLEARARDHEGAAPFKFYVDDREGNPAIILRLLKEIACC